MGKGQKPPCGRMRLPQAAFLNAVNETLRGCSPQPSLPTECRLQPKTVKLINLGLPRTGTTWFAQALRVFGARVVHNGLDGDYMPVHNTTLAFQEALSGD